MTSTADFMNTLLNPHLFQVIGSTPAGMASATIKAGLKGKDSAGLAIVTVSIFAASVNKATLETFTIDPKLAEARPIIAQSFSINGKTNMTALTLMGHCFLLSDLLDNVDYVRELKHKMGQRSLWDGDLGSSQLSAKQLEIFKQKKRLATEADARKFAYGFFKYVGIDNRPWTKEEAEFWDIDITRAAAGATGNLSPKMPYKPAPTTDRPSPPRRPQTKTPDTVTVQLTNGALVQVSKTAHDYYLGTNNGDLAALVGSIERRGADEFSKTYESFAARDPNMSGFSGSTIG